VCLEKGYISLNYYYYLAEEILHRGNITENKLRTTGIGEALHCLKNERKKKTFIAYLYKSIICLLSFAMHIFLRTLERHLSCPTHLKGPRRMLKDSSLWKAATTTK